METKNIFDLSNEELQQKFIAEFNENYKKEDYDDENWKEILNVFENTKTKLLETNFALSTYHEALHNLTIIKKKKDNSFSKIFLNSLATFFSKVGHGVSTVYKSISFIFSIPALTFSSIVLTLFIHLFLGIFLYAILPDFITDFMVKSVLAAVIFIVLKTIILFGLADKDLLFDYKMYFVKFIITIPFYSLVFLIFHNLQNNAMLEELFPLFYPHMWLSVFTHEYVYSPMIALLINCMIPIGVFLLVQKKTE